MSGSSIRDSLLRASLNVACVPKRQTDVRKRNVLLVSILSLTQFLIIMNTTAVNVALFAVSKDFQTPFTQLRWVANAYAITFAGFLLIGGDLCDKTGAARSFLLGAFILALGLLGSALAGGPKALSASLAVQGAGPAFLTPAIYAAIADAFPNTISKARAIGIWAAIAGTAQAVGPILGGTIVEFYGWRWIFWLELLIVTALMSIVVYPAWTAPRKTPIVHRPRQHRVLMRSGLLFVGPTLLVTAVMGYAAEGSRFWVAFLAAASATSLGILIFSEWFSRDPFLPPNLAANRTFILLNAIGCCLNFTYYGVSFLLAFHLQASRNLTAAETGLAFFRLAAMMCLGPAAAAKLARSHSQRSIMLIGLGIAVAGLGMTIAAIFLIESGVTVMTMLSMSCFGIGLTAPAMSTMLLIVLPSHRGVVASCLIMTRQLGSALGVTTFGGLLARAPLRPDDPLVTAAQLATVAIGVALVAAYFLPLEPRNESTGSEA